MHDGRAGGERKNATPAVHQEGGDDCNEKALDRVDMSEARLQVDIRVVQEILERFHFCFLGWQEV
jgi:hypothetical protein